MERRLGALRLDAERPHGITTLSVVTSKAANVEIAYGPTIWQLVKNLLDWGTPLCEEQGSVRLTVPVQTLPALAELFAK